MINLIVVIPIIVGVLTAPQNGDKDIETKIIKGHDTEPGQCVYQAACRITLTDGSKDFCGGSFIANNVILTAAHCLEHARSVEVILGANNVEQQEPGQVKVQSNQFTTHQGFDPRTLRNDIACIKLPRNVEETDLIKKIQLNCDNTSHVGETATVCGWGFTKEGQSKHTDKLQYLESTVISNQQCRRTYRTLITPGVLCVSGEGNVGACNGDSGGTLSGPNGKQIGIVSFGTAECSNGNPSCYTRISSYCHWINEHCT